MAATPPDPPRLQQGDPQGVVHWAWLLWLWLKKHWAKGEKGDKGDQGPPGEGGLLPFIIIAGTAGTDIQLTPDQFPAIIQVIWNAVPGGTDQVILPEPAEGMYGELFITYPKGAWVGPNVFELADENGTGLYTMGSAIGAGVLTNWFKLTVCEPVIGTPVWAWVLEKAAF